MLNKTISLLFLLVMTITLVVAQPIYKQNTEVELSLPCTINGALCSNSATCQFSIISPAGITLINQENMTQVGGLFTYQLLLNQTTEVGEHEFPVTCCDGGVCATRHLTYTITPSGLISSSGEAVIYIVLIVVVLFFFILCLIGAIRINGGDAYDIGGNLMELNYGKYLKMGLFWLSIVFLWFMFYLSWEVSNKVLMFGFVGDIFHTLFLILTYLLAPSFIAFVILAIVKWTADLKLWELAERGLKPR